MVSLCASAGVAHAALPTREAIIAGTSIDPTGSPIVELQLKGPNHVTFLCSGTVVGKRTILTAGHCVTGLKGISVRFEGGKRTIKAKSWWRHPRYAETADGAVRHDIGVVRLSKDIPRHIPVIRLATKNFKVGEQFFIYGYGFTEDDTVEELRGGIMTARAVKSAEIAAYMEVGASLTCDGDSGGPAMRETLDQAGEMRSEIVGLTSSGDYACAYSAFFQPVTAAQDRNFILKYLR